jgi:2,4-dienoyl-CoA reductase-like NADH-dependent reductase (Old Yellow Enzyme family)
MKLFDPLNINGMVVPNRIMVPAMVTRLSGEDGFVNEDITARYVRYAAGGVGLIVCEAMAPHHAKAGPLLRISEDRFVPGLAGMVRRVHETSDSKIVPQIVHFLKISRSGWRQTVDMLSVEDIDAIVDHFGDAVARSREAGFDGAELHGAHGYTLASFMSRANARTDDYGGETLEGRLRLVGRVMENVRRKAGRDFPVGIRFLADEYIREGHTVTDGKLIALRLAQLGFDYLSISVGGKFEDAVHMPGHVLHAYSGFSGDRCMPGEKYPRMLNTHLSEEIRRFLRSKRFTLPVIVPGKMDDPADAESVIAEGKADMVAIARGLLADPDWPNKVRRGELDRIVRCDYCNVCKQLDGSHQKVTCFLWRKGDLQAPPDQPDAPAPQWDTDGGGLTVKLDRGQAALRWGKPTGDAVHYDVYRADDEGNVRIVDGVKVRFWNDTSILGGMRYRYYVRPCGDRGHASAPSNSVCIEPAVPDYRGAPGTA